MKDLNDIIAQIVKFRDDRDWEQFHNGKDLALALSIEAAELNQLFLWKSADEVDSDKIKEELADISIVVTHSDIVEDWFKNQEQKAR